MKIPRTEEAQEEEEKKNKQLPHTLKNSGIFLRILFYFFTRESILFFFSFQTVFSISLRSPSDLINTPDSEKQINFGKAIHYQLNSLSSNLLSLFNVLGSIDHTWQMTEEEPKVINQILVFFWIIRYNRIKL